MPSWQEFISGFGYRELFLSLLIAAVIVLAREGKNIFGRKKNDTPQT